MLLDDGVPGRVELTGADRRGHPDHHARRCCARPTKVGGRARCCWPATLTPEPMRPGLGARRWRCPRSVLPHGRLLDIDERLEHAAARPVIVPETIVIDHGKVFVSDNFRAACRSLGINFQPAHPTTPAGQAAHRADVRLGRHAVLPVRRRLPRLATPNAAGRHVDAAAAVVADRRCRNCSTSGSWRSGRTGPTTGCATRCIPRPGVHPEREVRRADRDRRLRPGRAAAARTTSSCCPRPGGPSTPTASRSTTASTTARS